VSALPAPKGASGGADVGAATQLRAANIRTALTLLAIALVFFFGIIAAQYIGGPTIAIGVMGSATFLFLVVVIGRTLRK
jgi:hypothetical protein